MTKEDLWKLTNAPAVMPDGKMGLLIRVPTHTSDECGFQVAGEEDIRWVHHDLVEDAGNGALVVKEQAGEGK